MCITTKKINGLVALATVGVQQSATTYDVELKIRACEWGNANLLTEKPNLYMKSTGIDSLRKSVFVETFFPSSSLWFHATFAPYSIPTGIFLLKAYPRV